MAGPKHLSNMLPSLSKKMFGKKYLTLVRIISHWEDIVGPKISQMAYPTNISYGKRILDATGKTRGQATLELAATSANAAKLQYLLPKLMSRLNAFLGDELIRDIKLVHQQPKPQKRSKKPVAMNAAINGPIAQNQHAAIDSIADQKLRQALEKLSHSLNGANKR